MNKDNEQADIASMLNAYSKINTPCKDLETNP